MLSPTLSLNKDCTVNIFKSNSETSQKPAKSSIFDSFNNYFSIQTEPMSNAAQFWINSFFHLPILLWKYYLFQRALLLWKGYLIGLVEY